jgi:hypothetical protein
LASNFNRAPRVSGLPTLPMTDYQATLRVTPVGLGRWQGDELTGTLQGSFEKWLESLRDTMARLRRGFPSFGGQ